ncbi:Uma2 family endonuclease [Pannus brasiliensis CCIBt3594]|uniref:Uma2 family endonuclease n=1 Tax=Pannus brasiliensis CCIBt3594 TaxID=1427578 RepID=A0AAW9QZT0_9CHRO
MTLALSSDTFTLEDFANDPPEGREWIDGNLIEKTGMTIRHSQIQLRVGRLWGNYVEESGQGGEVYVELPCITVRQGRRPDVCYLTPDLVEQFGQNATLPQSPPLIAEIASPSDPAEDLFAKADEYLQSGSVEVWLVFPESRRVLIVTGDRESAFHGADEVSTQIILPGFRVSLAELFR